MKINFPEKTFLSIDELASRWACKREDIEYLLETKALPLSAKWAAIRGKRKILYCPYGYDESIYICPPPPPKSEIERVANLARSDDEIMPVPVPCNYDFWLVENQNRFWSDAEKACMDLREKDPWLIDVVILMSDIIAFEKSDRSQESPEDRRERIVHFVNTAHSQGRTKESAFAELAKAEACSVDNIKRIYKRKKPATQHHT